MAPRKMLTKPVEKALRKDMEDAITNGRLTLNENQTIDDVIEYIRAGIKDDTYWPGITFDEWYATLTQTPASASSGDEATVAGSGSEPDASVGAAMDADAIAAMASSLNAEETPAPADDATEIDDLADWLTLYNKAKAKQKECEEKAELAKRRITERLAERDATIATINGQPVATWTNVSQSYFDKKKCAEQYPDIIEEFTSTRIHKRFDVK